MAKRERSPSPKMPYKRQASAKSLTASCSSEETFTNNSAYGSVQSSPLRSPIRLPQAQCNNTHPRSQQLAAKSIPFKEDSPGSIVAEPSRSMIRKPNLTTHATALVRQTPQTGLQTPLPLITGFTPPADTFPIFHTGNVVIECNLVTPPRRWQLHSTILERNSSWFRDAIKGNSRGEDGQQITWSFVFGEHDDGHLALKTTGSGLLLEDNVVPKRQFQAMDGSLPTPPTSTTSEHFSNSDSPHAMEVELYHQLFGAFYSIPLTIPTTSVSATLSACDSFLRISDHLSITPLIATQLSTALKAHRHNLYIAISRDPARYLLLSIHLRDTAIYTESLIHIIGVWPCWPNGWSTRPNVLPAELKKISKRKASELHNLTKQTERQLLLRTINMPKSGPADPAIDSQFDTWFIVALFRSNLAKDIYALEGDRTATLKRGWLLRSIGKGGDAYMPYAETKRLIERTMPSALDNLKEDLNLLKETAMDVVQDVVKNRTLVDVEAEEIGWLTCAEIGEGDVVWEVEGTG